MGHSCSVELSIILVITRKNNSNTTILIKNIYIKTSVIGSLWSIYRPLPLLLFHKQPTVHWRYNGCYMPIRGHMRQCFVYLYILDKRNFSCRSVGISAKTVYCLLKDNSTAKWHKIYQSTIVLYLRVYICILEYNENLYLSRKEVRYYFTLNETACETIFVKYFSSYKLHTYNIYKVNIFC